LRGAPAGLAGAGPVRALAVTSGIWAVVSDAPLERFGGEALQEHLQDVETISRHALAHASVVEYAFRRWPVIPVKLFTIFSSDEKARAYLRTRSVRLRRLFSELRGHEEWGIRIIADQPDVRPGDALSGRDYLVNKRKLYGKGPSSSRVRETSRALAALGGLATKTRKESFPPPGQGRPFVAGASFLVAVKRRGRWRKEVARLIAALEAHDQRLELSGPWPPYHFVSK
jgi:hypothetical protein